MILKSNTSEFVMKHKKNKNHFIHKIGVSKIELMDSKE